MLDGAMHSSAPLVFASALDLLVLQLTVEGDWFEARHCREWKATLWHSVVHLREGEIGFGLF